MDERREKSIFHLLPPCVCLLEKFALNTLSQFTFCLYYNARHGVMVFVHDGFRVYFYYLPLIYKGRILHFKFNVLRIAWVIKIVLRKESDVLPKNKNKPRNKCRSAVSRRRSLWTYDLLIERRAIQDNIALCIRLFCWLLSASWPQLCEGWITLSSG